MGIFKEKTTNEGKTSNWNLIDWNEVTRRVCDLQTRIVKAMNKEDWKQVRSLQRLLTHSTAAKLLAVRQVTSNRGKRTPGVDGIVWNTPQAKYAAAESFTPKGYRAKPLRRVFIPKGGGKYCPLGIPGWSDKLLQEVIRMVLEAYYEPQFRESSHGFRPNRGCHTALDSMSKWKGVRWFIEGDIKHCFDGL